MLLACLVPVCPVGPLGAATAPGTTPPLGSSGATPPEPGAVAFAAAGQARALKVRATQPR